MDEPGKAVRVRAQARLPRSETLCPWLLLHLTSWLAQRASWQSLQPQTYGSAFPEALADVRSRGALTQGNLQAASSAAQGLVAKAKAFVAARCPGSSYSRLMLTCPNKGLSRGECCPPLDGLTAVGVHAHPSCGKDAFERLLTWKD